MGGIKMNDANLNEIRMIDKINGERITELSLWKNIIIYHSYFI